MNSILYFCNNGTIDPRLITSIGVNVKDTDSAIGQFGTGLKYAIAGIIRLGGSINIQDRSSGKDYFFSSREIEIRGKTFSFLTMASSTEPAETLSFTTDFGKHWEPWMLYRELRANAQDEGGAVETSPVRAATYDIVIRVDCPELSTVHEDRASIWLEGEPIWENAALAVFPSPSPYLFYRNMRATTSQQEWAFSYSIKDSTITEDRTFSSEYIAKQVIGEALTQCDNYSLLNSIFDSASEQSIDFSWYSTPSSTFKQVVLDRIAAHKKVPSSARDMGRRYFSEEFEAADFTIPETFSAMLAAAPAEASTVQGSKYEWMGSMEARMEGLELELKYWKACAKKLGGE